jgi:hypothetical protein
VKIQAYCQSEDDANRLASKIRSLDGGLRPSVEAKLVELECPEGDPDRVAVEALQEIALSCDVRAAIMLQPPAACQACSHYECQRRRGEHG